MSFHKLLQFKALRQVYGSSSIDFTEMALKNASPDEKAQFRNVCALIHIDLFNELESICGLLDLSKRKFIEGALIEAIANANRIIDEEGVHEHFAHMYEAHNEAQEEPKGALSKLAAVTSKESI